MTTYIALFNLTEAGIKAAKDSPRRLDAAKKLLADMGGEIKQFYMVMGEFDFVGNLRGAGRRRHGPLRPAARGPRLRAHEDAEGVPGDRLPRNHPVAWLNRVGRSLDCGSAIVHEVGFLVVMGKGYRLARA
jgi:GYD domain